jgi:hypothetical protein
LVALAMTIAVQLPAHATNADSQICAMPRQRARAAM